MISKAVLSNKLWAGRELKFVSFLIFTLYGAALAHIQCPLPRSTLQAFSSEKTVHFIYSYDPFNVTFDEAEDDYHRIRPDWVLTRKQEVECKWTLLTYDDDHLVSLTVLLSSYLQPGDCWTVYDGDSISNSQLGKVCEAEGGPKGSYRSSGGSLLLVYTQGGRPGLRSLVFRYKLEPKPNDNGVKKIAIIFSTVAVALGVCFLGFKFTVCCRPCRKRWCPALASDTREEEEGEDAFSLPRCELTNPTPSASSGRGHSGADIGTSPAAYTALIPSAPEDLADNGFEPSLARPQRGGECSGPSATTAFGNPAERRRSSQERDEEGGDGGVPGRPSAGVQVVVTEAEEGSGGGDDGGQPVRPPASGISHPPPSYESLFDTGGDGQNLNV